MNKKRRDILRQASDMVKIAKSDIESVCEDEQDAMECVPESFAENREKMENAIDALNDAASSLDEALESIEQAIEQ